MNSRNLPNWTPIFAVLAVSLTSCGSPATPLLAPPAAMISDKAIFGVVILARPVAASTSDTSIANGLHGVLSALHETLPPSHAEKATEFVVERNDGTTISLVAAVSAGDFPVGSRVEIVDGSQAELIHPN